MKKSKFIQERASTLQELANAGHPVAVYLADSHDQKHVTTASCKCGSCGTHFLTTAGLEPFCPNCRSDDVAIATTAATNKKVPTAELAGLKCPHCSSLLCLTAETASLMGGDIGCVSCGDTIKYETTAGDDGAQEPVFVDEDPINGADIEDVVDAVEADFLSESDDDDFAPTEVGDEEQTAGEVGPVAESDSDPEAAEGTPNPAPELAETQDGQDAQACKADVDQIPFGDDQTQQQADMQNVQDVEPTSVNDNQVIDEPAFEQFGEDEQQNLQFASVADRLTVWIKDTHVATLTPELAKENASVMHTAGFREAVKSEVAQVGLARTLQNFRFAPVTAKVKLSQAVAKVVTAKVQAKLEETAAAQKDYADNFLECMAIAAAGLNKSFFNKHTNLLKASLFDALSSAGVRKADTVIDRVFASTGDKYHKTILEIAVDLMAKSPDVRKQLSDAVQASNFIKSSDQDDEDGDEDADDTDDTTQEAALASPAQYKVNASFGANPTRARIDRTVLKFSR